MATAIGAHLSPEEFQWRMEDLASQAALEKIYATEAAIEASLEADYLYAEYTVMKEGGDINDLAELYMEAEENASGNKVGLIRKIINWIGRQISRFTSWVGKLFGKKGENIDPNQKAAVNKFDYENANLIVRGWNNLKTPIENVLTAIENKTGIPVFDAAKVLTPAGLGALAGGKFQQYKKDHDKNETIEITGAQAAEQGKDVNRVISAINKIINRINHAKETWEGHYQANVAKAEEKNANKNAAKANNANPGEGSSAPQDGQNNQGATQTQESTIETDTSYTVDDLFGYTTEADTRTRSEKQKKAMTGKAPASGNRRAVAVDQSKKTPTGTDEAKPTENDQSKKSSSDTGDAKPAENANKVGEKPAEPQQAETSAEPKEDQKPAEPAKAKTTAAPKDDQKPAEQQPAEKDPNKASVPQKIVSALLAVVQTLRDGLAALIDSAKSVFSKFGVKLKNVQNLSKKARKKNNEDAPNVVSDENFEDEKSGEQPANQEQTEGETQESTRELFGIDESEFDYLMEMTEEEEAEIAYLAENL